MEDEIDKNLSQITQIQAIKDTVNSLLELRKSWVDPIPAWNEIYCAASAILSRDQYQVCGEGTLGCIARHKHYDFCSDDPRYSN